MTRRPFEDLHPDAGVRPRVADATYPQRGERPVGIAAGLVVEVDRMPLGVHPQALLARQRALHGTIEQPRGERRLRLVAHVLLAAERSPVRDQFDGHLGRVDRQHASDVVTVVPHPLAAGVHVERTLVSLTGRHGQGRLGFEEGMLDALRVERLGDRERARRERFGEVGATRVRADRQHVGVGAPHRQRGIGCERRDRIGVRDVHVVGDLDEFGRRPGVVTGVGDDDRQHVAGVRGATTDGDQYGPVLVDDPDPQLAGQVGGGEHGLDAGCGEGRGRIDGHDVGAGVIGEVQRGVQHSGDPDVVDVVPLAHRQWCRFVLRAGTSDRGGEGRLERLAVGNRFDRVEDLHVPGATAQMGTEVRGHARLRQRRALLVDLGLGPHHDAGDAESALETTAGGERVGEALTLRFVDTLERDDRLALGLGDVVLTRHDRLAVDHHRATAALARRRATILR